MIRTRDERYGLLLAAAMVLSVLATTVPVGGTAAAPSPVAAVEYGDGTIEVVLDGAVASGEQFEATVTVNGERRTVRLTGDGSESYVVEADSDVRPVDDATVSFAGSATGEVAVRATGATVDVANGTATPGRVYVGTAVAVVTSDAGSAFDVAADGDRVTTRATGRSSRVFVYDTSDFAGGTTLEFEGRDGGTASLALAALDLRVSAPSTVAAGESFDVTATADAVGRDVEFVLLDGDGDAVGSTMASLNGTGEAAVSLRVADAGDYAVVVSDANTGVSATSSTIAVTGTDAGTPTATSMATEASTPPTASTPPETSTPTLAATETPAGGGIPGLGAGVAAVALLGAALLAAGRRG